MSGTPPSKLVTSTDGVEVPRTLRFPRELEKEFREWYDAQFIGAARAAFVLGLTFYISYGVLDVWAAPASYPTFWLIRYAIVCPIIAAAVVVSFLPAGVRLAQAALALVGSACGLGIVAMITIAQPDEPLGISYYGGLVVVILFADAFSRLRFYYGLFTTGIIVASYEAATLIWKIESITGAGWYEFINQNVFLTTCSFVALTSCYYLDYYSRRDFLQERALEFGRRKVEELLLNILPADVAARLKQHSGTIADQLDSVSILFADIQGFTPLSSRLKPVPLVDLLNELFTSFDGFLDAYRLEKIKTIGDCYMVASGVPAVRDDHAQMLVRFALRLLHHVESLDRNPEEQVNLRIGISSGRVVAGVIGRRKFSYDLWGDTVNIASRMESHGEAGRVQISRATYELIKDDFVCEPRGQIQVKGVGSCETWFVVRER